MTTEEKIDKITESLNELGKELKLKSDHSKEENFKAAYKVEADLKALASKIDLISDRIREKELQDEMAKKESKDKKVPWWGTLVSFMALPTAIVTALLLFRQSESASSDARLKEVQTSNAELDGLEKRLALLTDSVSIAKLKTIEEREELRSDVAEINKILVDIREIKASNNTNILVSRYIVIYLFFVGISLIFRIFNLLWHNFFDAIRRYFYSVWDKIEWDSKVPEKKRSAIKSRRKYLEWSYFIINAVPSVIHIIFDFLIVTIVVLPLFNSASIELQSAVTSQDIIQSMLRLDFSGAVQGLKDIIF